MKWILLVLALCLWRYISYVPQRTFKGGEAVMVLNATSEIGWHSALELNRKNITVYAGVLDMEVGNKLKSSASNATAMKPIFFNVRNRDSVKDAVRHISSELGEFNGLTGLVNNAVLLSSFDEFTETPADVWRESFEVNVLHVVEATKAFIPLLQKGEGNIVFYSNILGMLGMPFSSVNSAVSFALEGFVESLRREVAPLNVKVSVVTSNIPDAHFVNYTSNIDPEFCSQQIAHRRNFSLLLLTPFFTHPDPKKVGSVVADATTAITPKSRYDLNLLSTLLTALPSSVSDWILSSTVSSSERILQWIMGGSSSRARKAEQAEREEL